MAGRATVGRTWAPTSEDRFEVYRGGVNDPLNTFPVRRYTAKDSLDVPPVAAVEQFRKEIEESEKQSPRDRSWR